MDPEHRRRLNAMRAAAGLPPRQAAGPAQALVAPPVAAPPAPIPAPPAPAARAGKTRKSLGNVEWLGHGGLEKNKYEIPAGSKWEIIRNADPNMAGGVWRHMVVPEGFRENLTTATRNSIAARLKGAAQPPPAAAGGGAAAAPVADEMSPEQMLHRDFNSVVGSEQVERYLKAKGPAQARILLQRVAALKSHTGGRRKTKKRTARRSRLRKYKRGV